ncbi:hypothetical protein CTAM01_05166 [Colletotrichum tamarilloi]|uniref:Uncharacterized protein n=1 Tax=Colletotrichum tamarilloi TaxID=1209934 RepID=A0ABQ9REX6_9PEZI|nr:uncharacterized protein CTAM01_05166 [Colletotrichum tamarilloi]KAK1502353.1 hypothetical protein CTAM01_05166 [Colletotrichum tamarilloi]
MPPSKVSRVAKSSGLVKKPATASAPRSKTSETASSKKKQKKRASAKKSNTPKPAETSIVIAGHKRSIVVVEEDSNDDGTIQPSKRRRTGGNTNAHDYHAVRERPPPRDYGATFARKSTAHFTWGALLMSPPLQPQSSRSAPKNKSTIPRNKGKEVVRPRSWQARPSSGRYSGILSRTATPESELEPQPKSRTCPFLRIPLEIREDIYKYILVADEPIRVHQGWSAVYPRNRVGIRTELIRTCRQVRKEALNTLYGENTFLYLLRDAAELPALNAQGENEIVVQHPLATDNDALSDYEADSADEYSDEDDVVTNRPSSSSFLADGHTAADIDIRRFGHKFRKLMIVAEANRANAPYRLSMANAINVFRGLRPIRPRIHTLTIDITPQRDPRTGDVSFLDFFERSSEVVRTLRGLPCQFIEILVNTGVSVGSSSGGDGDGSGGDGGDSPGKGQLGQEKIVLNMKYAANIRRAKRGEKDLWRDDRVMQSYRSAKAGEAQKKLDSLPAAIRKIWEATNGQFKRRQQDEFGDDEEDYCCEDWEDSLLFQDGTF